jgi:catechol 2,3-dioxygenase-like lactoylglutathione lyase family enzyme
MDSMTQAAMHAVAPFELGIVADDIDAMLAFYAGVLGMRVLSDLRMGADKGRASGLAPEGYRIVRLESDHGDRLKLARPADGPQPATPPDHAMQRRGGSYVTFIVDDVDSLHLELVRSGASIRSRGVVELRPGVRLVLAADPEGNFVEFLQYDDLASYRPSKAGA